VSSTQSIFRKAASLFLVGLLYTELIEAADHIQIRTSMIESQLAQVETTAVLVVGDSIIESWLVGPTGACQVINAGLGGGGVRNVIALLSNLREKKMGSKLSGIVVAIGVNDAQLRDLPPNYVHGWKKNYEEMIDLALHLHPTVSVSTILPVEDGRPLGSKYFDQSLIESLNATIRQIAKSKRVGLIDTSKIFREPVQKKNFTVDGVHLTADAYKIFTKQLVASMPRTCGPALVEGKRRRDKLPN
jgi:lysophospholipase L1-like esterase